MKIIHSKRVSDVFFYISRPCKGSDPLEPQTCSVGQFSANGDGTTDVDDIVGVALFAGMCERMTKELMAIAASARKFKVIALQVMRR